MKLSLCLAAMLMTTSAFGGSSYSMSFGRPTPSDSRIAREKQRVTALAAYAVERKEILTKYPSLQRLGCPDYRQDMGIEEIADASKKLRSSAERLGYQQQSDVLKAREQSKVEALKLYPDAGDDTTDLGKEVGRVIKALTDKNDPILYRLDAPMVVVQMAARNLGIAPKGQPAVIQPGQFVVAIADEPHVPTGGQGGWNVEKGEIYKYLGMMKDGVAVLQVGSRTINANPKSFRMVLSEESTQAVLVYNREIKEDAAHVAQHLSTEVPNASAAPVTPNAYGLGVNADMYGREHTYRQPDGEQLSPVLQDSVTRDAYGLGAHMDTFGRKVYDSAP